jgi:hypothetical protein
LADALARESEGPSFYLIAYMFAHTNFNFLENGELNPGDPLHISSYPGHHNFLTRVLTLFIDMILEHDPDAVIVLQADHGIHSQSEQLIMQGLGIPKENVADIWNGTMSAVRVPHQYGILNEPLHPLNISRWLVNNFVGENYLYIE